MEDCIDISMSKNGNTVAFITKHGRVFIGNYSDYIARKKKTKVVRLFLQQTRDLTLNQLIFIILRLKYLLLIIFFFVTL